LHDLLLHKNRMHRVLHPMVRMYTDVKSIVRVGMSAAD